MRSRLELNVIEYSIILGIVTEPRLVRLLHREFIPIGSSSSAEYEASDIKPAESGEDSCHAKSGHEICR